ncbi:PLP-dependent transferase [Bacillus sp. SL00103]
MDAVALPVFAVSLGAVESILSYPAKMSHAAMPKKKEEKEELQMDYFVLSVGVENGEDLKRDFKQALDQLKPVLVQPIMKVKKPAQAPAFDLF